MDSKKAHSKQTRRKTRNQRSPRATAVLPDNGTLNEFVEGLLGE